MKKILSIIFAISLFMNAYSQTDLAIINFVNDSHNPVGDINLSQNDDFSPIAWIINNGSETISTGTVLTFSYYVDDDTLLTTSSPLAQDLAQDGSMYLNIPTLSSEIISEHAVGDYFELCLSISLSSDVNTANNAKCLMVTRETAINESVVTNLSIFPNPTKDYFYIHNADNATIQMYDLNGKEILYRSNVNNSSIIYTNNLASGIYILKVNQQNNIFTNKILILE
ncbi:MAG: T9SS type A sorting domain-containing protein [Bacteroidales bacterium]|nr:T9SS type A sorting domain-containing protein [Bacteroidales bacterium]